MTDISFSLPRPRVSADDADLLVRDVWQVAPARVTELGSNQDRNFLVETADERFVLKVGNPAIPISQLETQNRAFAALGSLAPAICAPALVPTAAGEFITMATLHGVDLPVRLVSWAEGEPLAALRPGVEAARSLGRAAGLVVQALADLAVDPEPSTAWDLRLAADLVEELAGSIADEEERAAVLDAAREAVDRLAPVVDALPVQAIHGDLTDDNVVAAPGAPAAITGVIDLGDVGSGWRIAELAVGMTALLPHLGDHPLAVIEQARAFDEVVPLSDDEIRALWPLVVLRGAALVAAGRHQAALDGNNDYVLERLAHEWRCFASASEIGFDEAELALRAALRPETFRPMPEISAGMFTDAPAGVAVDLSVFSPALDAGAWLDADVDARTLEAAWGPGRVALTRHGEGRPSQARPLSASVPRTIALGVQVLVDRRIALHAPFAGDVRVSETGHLVLTSATHELTIGGAAQIASGPTRAGALIGVADSGSGPASELVVRLSGAPGLTPPRFVRPGDQDLWALAAPDPRPLLGLGAVESPDHSPADTTGDAGALLERRDASYARVHERYFAAPPRIERGWRHHLLDEHGRVYLDMLNNVTAVGHGHPRLADAVAAQWRRLNTNSRFLYGELVRYTERLAALAPDGLDTVFLVNSGTEAVDLAVRLARTASGRPTVVALREAYHGWSMASDAVSSSLNDNPGALATRPDWVTLADVPNPVRGTHLGADSGPAYVRDLEALLTQLNEAGTPVGGFIGEAVFGNGGGVLLPDGYLAGAYAAVRARGGIVIADEVQVGFGRLGEHFWAFEQQGAVPDVITIAKSIGNGHPLGAVITTREIAEAFRAEGSFFSSAGGSPVSCVVGNTVLDILEDEQLIANARGTGGLLRDGLVALGEGHDAIGAVHGMGFYLGVELVSDRAAMTPDGALATAVCDDLLTHGVIVLPTGDGKNVLKIKPPMTLDADAVAFFLEQLDRALTRMN